MTNNDDLALKLKAAAEKATALNLDTAQVQRGNDGYYECPVCCGAGEVEAKTDFCNIDGVALGVQFYGIGEHHGAAEAYFRAVAPANILSLLAERTADKAENASLRQRVAELEEIATEYGMKFQRAQDDLKKARILCEDATMRANRADFEGYSRAVREYGSKTVSVKLPKTFWYEHDDLAREVAVLDKRLVKKALREACAAAGIKLEVGE